MTVRRCLFLAVIALTAIAVAPGCSADKPTSGGPAFRSRIAGSLFTADTAIFAGSAPWKLVTGDFDLDSTLDIASANILEGTIVVLRNIGENGLFGANLDSGYLDTAYAETGGYAPTALAAADVDADGRMDIVAAYGRRDTSVTDDSTWISHDRILVLLNREFAGYEIALDDTLVDMDIRDLYVGATSKTDQSVRIIANSSTHNTTLSEYLRPAHAPRLDKSGETFLEFSGSIPADDAKDISVNDFITVWFSFPVAANNITKFATDTTWARVYGALDSLPARRIGIASARSTKRTTPSTASKWYDLIPSEPFLPGETITVVLDSVKGTPASGTDFYGLEESVSFSFTTENLKVVATYPAPDEDFIPLDAPIELALNGPADPESVVPSAFSITGDGGREIPFTASYSVADRSIMLQPTGGYEAYETITVTASNAVLDSVGRAIFDPFTMSFRSTGPEVATTSPYNGELFDCTQPIRVLFNTDVMVPDPSLIIVNAKQSGIHPVETVTHPGGFLDMLQFTPTGDFYAGEQVTVTILRDVTDVLGTSLARPHTWTYYAAVIESAALTRPDVAFEVTYAGGTIAGGQFVADGAGIALTGMRDSIAVLMPDGNGSWTVVQVADSLAMAARTIRAADLNADGLADLVAALPDSDLIQVFLNTSIGSTPQFSDPDEYLVGIYPADLFIGDLNGDGLLDIATVNSFTNDVSILINEGEGAFASEVYTLVGNLPKGITGGDFDGDGDIDLAVANTGGRTITLLRNQTMTSGSPDAE